MFTDIAILSASLTCSPILPPPLPAAVNNSLLATAKPREAPAALQRARGLQRRSHTSTPGQLRICPRVAPGGLSFVPTANGNASSGTSATALEPPPMPLPASASSGKARASEPPAAAANSCARRAIDAAQEDQASHPDAKASSRHLWTSHQFLANKAASKFAQLDDELAPPKPPWSDLPHKAAQQAQGLSSSSPAAADLICPTASDR
mmetsp:Transcript_5100/g.8300  ORF Transcript_5100/g.8300 Transcript_5100/m.8300 type:complete len:207 (+) Transcript_5100:184-804(+)